MSGAYGPLLCYLVLDLLGAAQDFLHSRVPDRAHDLFVARPNDLLGKILAHAHPPTLIRGLRTLPLSVRTPFLAFIRRRGFTFLRPRPRFLNFLVGLRLLIDLLKLLSVDASLRSAHAP